MRLRHRLVALAVAGTAALSIGIAAASIGQQPPPAPPKAVKSPNVCVTAAGSRSWCGDGDAADSAKLAGPSDVAVARDGSLLIADTRNSVIRRVRRDGVIVSIAGTGAKGSAAGDDTADEATFRLPEGVAATVRGAALVADTGNHVIREVAVDGTVTALVGRSGRIRADLDSPRDVVVAANGDLLISDSGHHRVLRVTSAAAVVVVAGNGQPGSAGDGGPATAARLRNPAQVAETPDGGLLIADAGNGAVRRVLPTGTIETLTSGLTDPSGVLQLPDGSVLVAAAAGIHQLVPGAPRQRIAGATKRGFNGDQGSGLTLLFDGLGQLAVDAAGRVLFSERESDRIRSLADGGEVTTVAGTGIPVREPTLDIPAGKPPPALFDDRAAAGRVPSVGARSAAASACERYDSRYSNLNFKPMTKKTLKVRGRKRIGLKFVSSAKRANIAVVIVRNGRTVGQRFEFSVKGRAAPRRIRVSGPFKKGRHIGTLWGISLIHDVRRCDVKVVRIRVK
jgi:NHL repeat